MPDRNERGGPATHRPASEDLATSLQLDLHGVDGTPTADSRARTEPDPAARRRNLERGRRPAAAPDVHAGASVPRSADIDAGATAALTNTPVGARRHAERCLDKLAATGQPFDAEDLRAAMGGHIPGAHANAISAVFRIASRDGRIRQVGWREASRPEARGRVLRVWQGTGVRR